MAHYSGLLAETPQESVPRCRTVSETISIRLVEEGISGVLFELCDV